VADPQWILDAAEKNKRLGRILGLRSAARIVRNFDFSGTMSGDALVEAARELERKVRKLEKEARRG